MNKKLTIAFLLLVLALLFFILYMSIPHYYDPNCCCIRYYNIIDKILADLSWWFGLYCFFSSMLYLIVGDNNGN